MTDTGKMTWTADDVVWDGTKSRSAPETLAQWVAWRAGAMMFTESLHPRDPSGKFGSGGGATAVKQTTTGVQKNKPKPKRPVKKVGLIVDKHKGKKKVLRPGHKVALKGTKSTHKVKTGPKKQPTYKPTADEKQTVKVLEDLVANMSEQMTAAANAGDKEGAAKMAASIAAMKNVLQFVQAKAYRSADGDQGEQRDMGMGMPGCDDGDIHPSWDDDQDETDVGDLSGLTLEDFVEAAKVLEALTQGGAQDPDQDEQLPGKPTDVSMTGGAREQKPAPLGEGGRFEALKAKLAAKGAHDPGALAAWIGRKKYGKSTFQKLASTARKGKGGSRSSGLQEWLASWEQRRAGHSAQRSATAEPVNDTGKSEVRTEKVEVTNPAKVERSAAEINAERRAATRNLVVIRSCAASVTLSDERPKERVAGPDGARLCRASYRLEDTADGGPVMVVRFSVFDDPYEINSIKEGKFIERVAPGAFAKTIMERADQVKVMFNHGQDGPAKDMILGKVITLEERADGAYAEVELFDTSYNRDILPGLRAGVYGSSFMFHVVDDEWNDYPQRSDANPNGLPERTVRAVRLLEFGPVTWPANPSTTAGLRSDTDQYTDRIRSASPDSYDSLAAEYARFREVYNLTETREEDPTAASAVEQPIAPADTDTDRIDQIDDQADEPIDEPDETTETDEQVATPTDDAPVPSEDHADEPRNTNSSATRRSRLILAGVISNDD